MKPCHNQRKLIVWLALDALTDEQARPLRAHLETCAGCRCYFQEIARVKEKLVLPDLGTELEASDAFHLRVVRAIGAEHAGSVWQVRLRQLRSMLVNPRLALPSLVTGAVVLVALCFLLPYSHRAVAPPSKTLAASPSNPAIELAPTISNYQLVANRSLEKLDDLLTQQGLRNASALPAYTASTLLGSDASE